MPAMQLSKSIQRYPAESAIALLLAILYGPLLIHWIDGWLNKSVSIEHEYFSYAIIGFPYAGMAAWQARSQWRKLPDQLHLLGIAFIAIALVFYTSALTNLINLSLPILLAGLALALKGLPGIRLMGMPLLFVLLATPTDIPYLVAPYLMPLQRVIAIIVGTVLSMFGMAVTVDQSYILVSDRIVEVAPYCAGLKMLMTCLYLALLLLHWTGNLRHRWKVITMLTGAVLISFVGNLLRNALLTFFHGTDQTAWFDWLHESWGGDVFSALLLLAVITLMQQLDRLAATYQTRSVKTDAPVNF